MAHVIPLVHIPQQQALPPLPQRILREISVSGLFTSHAGIKGEIGSLSTAQLKELLEGLIVQAGAGKKGLAKLDLLAEWIPLVKLEEATRLQHAEHVNAIQTAKRLFSEAKYFLKTTECKAPLSVRVKLQNVLETMINVLESFLNAFGLAEFFKPAENDMHADFKGQKIMLLLSLFSMVSAILIPVLGASLAGMIIGGTLLSIAGMSLIYPLIRPAPSRLPKGENWTRECRLGKLPTVDGRKKTLDDIASTLIASRNAKTHVMLLGKTGVGKTETIKALVAVVERGDYPELKGKQIIYFNTADLVNNTEMFSYGNQILSRISSEMGRHRDKYILVFDEIHVACQDEDSGIANQMKTLLDNGKENFPHVICITTEEEFFRDIYVKHAAFARRFKRIAVENTGDPETIKILNNALIKRAPKIILEQGALLALMQKTREAFGADSAMPAMALKILSLCIEKTSETQKSPLENRVEALREQIQSIYSQGAVGQGQALLPYGRVDLAPALEAELVGIEGALKAEKEQIERLFACRDRLAEAKRKMYQLAVKIAGASEQALNQKEGSAFLLLSHYLAPKLEATVRAEAARLSVKVVIDDALIAKVIAEEQANIARADAAVVQGRAQIAARVAE